MRARAARVLRRLAHRVDPVYEVTVRMDSAPIVARIEEYCEVALEHTPTWRWPQ